MKQAFPHRLAIPGFESRTVTRFFHDLNVVYPSLAVVLAGIRRLSLFIRTFAGSVALGSINYPLTESAISQPDGPYISITEL